LAAGVAGFSLAGCNVHFVHPNIEASSAVLRAIGFREPFYIIDAQQPQGWHLPLSEGERAYWQGKPSTLAATSPVTDLVYRVGALRYDYKGRGFCCVLWRGAFQRSQSEVIGSVLHEAAHYVNYAPYPEREERDPCRAMAMFSKNAAFRRDPHGETFLRACAHLWRRATKAGYLVPLADVIDHERYGHAQSKLLSAVDEAVRWESESLAAVERRLVRDVQRMAS
jgi:hypothetical protein